MAAHTADGFKNAIAPQFGAFVTNLSFEQLQTDVVEAAKTLVMDQIACELIGSTLPWVAPAIGLARMCSGARPDSTMVNHGDRLPCAEAAFINASFGQACEMDDAASSGGHIGTATIPAAMAVGERQGSSGKEVLTAIVSGYEVMQRLMQSVYPSSAVRGFHSQTIGGPFAAAAATARLLKLDAQKTTHAIAIAGSHAGGATEYDQSGGEVKRIHAGIAARGGVHSGLLADMGLTGPPTIVEGRRGFCHIFADKVDPSWFLKDLGTKFHIGDGSFKMFPTVGALHTTIVACNKLVQDNDLKPDDVVDVQAGFDEQAVLHTCSIRQPTDVMGAQYSLAFSVALCLTRRGHDLAHYINPAMWSDPELLSIMPRIHGYHDPEAAGRFRRRATVTMTLRDGRVLKTVENYMLGSPANPAGKEAMEAKVRRLAATALPADRVEQIVRAVQSFETIKDVRAFMRLLVQSPRP